jgi:hypothetical protein
MEIGVFMKDKLKVGDIIVVSNPLFGLREYEVLSIEGNKAITKFRTFNTKIYPGGNVYEYGKKYTPSGNGYWIKKGEF